MRGLKTLFFLLAALSLAGCRVVVIHELKEEEANAILAALNREGIAADKVRTGGGGARALYGVEVGRADAVTAWKVLRKKNLPRPRTEGLGEVFGSRGGIVPTSTQQQALMRHAVAGELSKTLQSVEGVVQARVHVVLPARNPLAPRDAPRPGARASVLLRVEGKPPLTEDQVRKLVAGGVSGLSAQSVSVLVVRSRPEQTTTTGAAARLARMGPFTVVASSRTPLLVTLIVGLGLMLGASLLALLLLWKNRGLALAQRRSAVLEGEVSRDLESSLSLLDQSFSSTTPRSTEE